MPLYFLPEERRPEAAEALSDAEGEALADAEAEAVSEAVADSADPGHPLGFRLSVPCVPCVSAEFRQNLVAKFRHSFCTVSAQFLHKETPPTVYYRGRGRSLSQTVRPEPLRWGLDSKRARGRTRRRRALIAGEHKPLTVLVLHSSLHQLAVRARLRLKR